MSGPAPRTSLVVPTYNEHENVGLLLPRLAKAMADAGLPLEIVIADDNSPDGTADAAQAWFAGQTAVKGTVLRRTGPRGLAPAVIDGLRAASGEFLGVIDADLSHPPELVPQLVRACTEGGAELAIGSRYVKGGGVKDWPFKRRLMSRLGCFLAWPVTRVHDATAGFFLFRRSVIEGVALDAAGFKIGLEIFVKGNYTTRREVPFVFADREHGLSKLGGRVMVQYGWHLVRLFAWRVRHGRFGRARVV